MPDDSECISRNIGSIGFLWSMDYFIAKYNNKIVYQNSQIITLS